MILKWTSALVAATALGAFATANVIAALVPGAAVPIVVNLLLLAAGTIGGVLVIVAELYRRLDARLDVLSDFLVRRLDEIVARLDGLESGLDREPGIDRPPVVPFQPRPARAYKSDDR